MFQDGSDGAPTDPPLTPSTPRKHPPDERSRLGGTDDSPPRSNGRPWTRSSGDRACSRPPPPGGPTLAASITPSPKRRSPSADASDRRRTGRGATIAESAPAIARPNRPELPRGMSLGELPNHRRVESDERALRYHPFASRRFHVLLNSLFKVLFNFPSRYLFAIGLVSVFSLRSSLRPTLGCNLKQPDS